MKTFLNFIHFGLITLLICCTGCKQTNKTSETNLSVSAAANLRDVLQELKVNYQKDYPDRNVSLTFGSSGMLTQQIMHGAPFDVFLSADTIFPIKLIENKKSKGKAITYTYGEVVMWSSKFEVSKGLDLLLDDNVQKVAIANPDLAPYGKATVQMLEKFKLYPQIKHKIVWAENINQAAQFASTGNTDIAFISLSNALSPEMKKRGKYYKFDPEHEMQIAQGAVIIKGKNETEAQKFLDYIIQPKMKPIWEKFGYKAPQNQP